MTADVNDTVLPQHRPVLTGGTGRSGSTVVGRLLDNHPDLALTRPMEVRFIAGNHGIADAAWLATHKPEKAHAAAELAVDRLLDRWYRRAEDVGLHTTVHRGDLGVWCKEYLDAFDADPVGASRTLTEQIMAAVIAPLSAPRWVDTTPANARRADRVEVIYPHASVIAVIRDGRDVAASFVNQTFGPDDVFEALAQWERRMLMTHQAIAAAAPGRVLVVDLLDLVVRDRQATLATLLDFIGVPPSDALQTWFDKEMSASAAHVGRWRSGFDAETTARIDNEYAQITERLAAQGVRLPAAD